MTNENSIQEKNYEHLEVTECLLSFEAKSFVIQFIIKKLKDLDIQNCNFVCCFVWVSKLVAHIEGGTEAEVL